MPVAVAFEGKVVGNVGSGVLNDGVASVIVCVTNGSDEGYPPLSKLVIKGYIARQSGTLACGRQNPGTYWTTEALLVYLDGLRALQ